MKVVQALSKGSGLHFYFWIIVFNWADGMAGIVDRQEIAIFISLWQNSSKTTIFVGRIVQMPPSVHKQEGPATIDVEIVIEAVLT